MAQSKATLLAVLALCTAIAASPVVKSDASSTEEEIGAMFQELKEMCRNNSGSDEAFDTLMKTAKKAFYCVDNAFDPRSFTADLLSLTNETRPTFFARYCPQLRNAYTCTQKLFNDFRPCAKKVSFTVQKALFDVIPDAVEMMCKNEGEVLSKVEQPLYLDFFDKVGKSLNKCANRLNGKGIDNRNIYYQNQDQCNKLSDVRQCVQDKFNIYKAPDLINVYDLFHNTLSRMTPCRNYMVQPKVTVIEINHLNEVLKIED